MLYSACECPCTYSIVSLCAGMQQTEMYDAFLSVRVNWFKFAENHGFHRKMHLLQATPDF